MTCVGRVVLAVAASLALPGAALAAAPTRPGEPVPPESIQSLARPQAGHAAEAGQAVPAADRDPGRVQAAKARGGHGGGAPGHGPSPKTGAISPANHRAWAPPARPRPTRPARSGRATTSRSSTRRSPSTAAQAWRSIPRSTSTTSSAGPPTATAIRRSSGTSRPTAGSSPRSTATEAHRTSSSSAGPRRPARHPLPTSSGAGNWCRFAQATGSAIDDYPKLATNDGHLVIGSNVFQGNSYLTARIWAYEQPPLGDQSCATPPGFSFGSAASPLLSADGDLVFTPVPAQGRTAVRTCTWPPPTFPTSGRQARSWSGT